MPHYRTFSSVPDRVVWGGGERIIKSHDFTTPDGTGCGIRLGPVMKAEARERAFLLTG